MDEDIPASLHHPGLIAEVPILYYGLRKGFYDLYVREKRGRSLNTGFLPVKLKNQEFTRKMI